MWYMKVLKGMNSASKDPFQLARYIVLCQSSWCITDYPFCWHTCVFSLFLLCPCCPNLDCHGRLLQLWSELSVDILVSYEHCFLERDAKVRQQTSKVVFEKDGSESVLIESGRPRLAVSPPADKPSRCSRRWTHHKVLLLVWIKERHRALESFFNETDWLSSSQFSFRYMICRFAKAMNVHSWYTHT